MKILHPPIYRRKTIASKLLLLIMSTVLIPTALFFCVFFLGGTLRGVEDNALDSLNEKTANRARDLEFEMIQRWSNLEETVQQVQSHADQVLSASGASASALTADSPLTGQLLPLVADDLLYALRKNSVTGVFVIYNGEQGTELPESGSSEKAGLYFRDSDPTTVSISSADILVERAPSDLVTHLNLAMDSYWNPTFTFTADQSADSLDYYYKPLQAATAHPEIEPKDLAYWSKPFLLNDDTTEIITYSLPLRSSDGTVYGVLGIELSCDYLRTLLPYQELNDEGKGGYLLAMTLSDEAKSSSPADALGRATGTKETIYHKLVSSGPILSQLVGDLEALQVGKQTRTKGVYQLLNPMHSNDDVYISLCPLKLYNTNTPFEQEQWVLTAIEKQSNLFYFSNALRRLLMITLAISLLVGLGFAYISSTTVTRPISALVDQIKNSDPHKPLKLGRVKIDEIDDLSKTIETLSQNVADSASKLSQIISMAGISIGAFEYRDGEAKAFCTSQFFSMFQLPQEIPPDGYVDVEILDRAIIQMEENLESAQRDPEDGSLTRIYRILGEDSFHTWLRLKLVVDDSTTMGVLTDITQETIEKKKIEHDRDYDLLTDLYNRRAFSHQIQQLFRTPKTLGIAALIMLDLDNLKYINDTYGHDFGDEYIRRSAKVLQRSCGPNSLVSRMAGDEFLIFLYGYGNREEARISIRRIQDALASVCFPLPDNTDTKIRASAGYAWYPDDTDDSDVLIRYADFAMYLVKRTTKGQFAEFDKESYLRNSYLLDSREELNTLIEKGQLNFAFQPIVNAKNGQIYGYEALMRPNMSTIKNPTDLLSLARSQSKLYEIERLTLFRGLDSFTRLPISRTGCKLFLNSIGNQILSPTDMELFEQQYPEYLSRLVIELTEEDRANDTFTTTKLRHMKRWKAQMALDDFGAGYNGETVLLDLMPNLIKLDLSLIQNIHVDSKRLNLLRPLVSYMHDHGIGVIAEGVERKEEMDLLIREGVDYLQGFYLAVPSFDPQGISPDILEQIRTANESMGD